MSWIALKNDCLDLVDGRGLDRDGSAAEPLVRVTSAAEGVIEYLTALSEV